MNKSKTAMPWVEFSLSDEGREKRNEVARRRLRLDSAQCKTYIDHLLEVELKHWAILT
jgi:hypothetical protein